MTGAVSRKARVATERAALRERALTHACRRVGDCVDYFRDLDRSTSEDIARLLGEDLAQGRADLDRAIQDAKTDAIAFDAVCCLAGLRLRDNALLWDSLRHFMAAVLLKEIVRPQPRKGTDPRKAVLIADILVSVGRAFEELPMTRNSETRHRKTVCDVVAEALQKHGVRPNSYAAVKAILHRIDRGEFGIL
jgi:hypothetical protein